MLTGKTRLNRTERENNSGFTLIEIVLVISLILLIVFVMMSFSQKLITEKKTNEKVSLLINTIHSLREKAVSDRATCSIDKEEDKIIFKSGGTIFRKIAFEEDPEMTDRIFFNRNGYTTGGEIIITADEDTFTISIKSPSGDIVVAKDE